MLTSQPKLAIGIDIGGTTTKFGIVTLEGEIIEQDKISSTTYTNIHLFIDELYSKLFPLITKAGGIQQFAGIGVGAPNGNYYTGTIEYAPNLIWKGIIPLTDLLYQKFNLPVKLTNDANAAAAGEMKYGKANGIKHFIMITLGTGVGSGIVIDGKILLGHDGFAGELGHTIIRHGGRLHKGTGAFGSLEAYASANGVKQTAIEFLAEDATNSSLLKNYKPEEINSEIVYKCALQGDTLAKKVFDFTGEILGEALANFVMFSSPQMIILFGGLSKAAEFILIPTKTSMEKNLLPIFRNKVQLVFSDLHESDAAILGASALVWEK
jgi:glucokinase